MNVYKERNSEQASAIMTLLNTAVVAGDFMVQGEKVTLDQTIKLLENPQTSLFLAKDDLNNFVGFCLVNRKSAYEFNHQVTIQALATLSNHRNKGIAQALLQEVVNWVKAEKIELIQLDVVDQNISAIKLYERIGMKECGRLPRGFRKDGQYYDIVTYCLCL